MKAFARQLALVLVAGTLSWWLFLHGPAPDTLPRAPVQPPLSVALTPLLPSPPPQTVPRLERVAPAEEPVASEPAASEASPADSAPTPEQAPPPAELGAPEGEGEAAAEPEVAHEEPAEAEAEDAPVPPDAAGPLRAEELMATSELVEAAEREFAGEARQGFATVLVASPEQQVEIARFFGEELVLVPRGALDPGAENPRYFRLSLEGTPGVRAVSGRPALESYRQYRDLFDYEYARLPAPLRALRRSVLSRSEVYLFAALIPPREWAVVIGRRREALVESGRDLSEVERFVARYLARSGGGFDVFVEEIVFADGSSFRPRAGSSPVHGG